MALLRLRLLALRLGRRCVFSACALMVVVVSFALLSVSGRESPDPGLRLETAEDGGGKSPVPTITQTATVVIDGKETDTNGALPFRIIVLTQRRHWSLRRLLESVDAADYSSAGPGGVHLEIRIDYDHSYDHNETVDLARRYDFRHGTKKVVTLNATSGLQYAWFEAWMPASNSEKAVILEDDMELSPLWFSWLTRAWDEYGDRDDLGGVSLCRQRLRASDGKHFMFENDDPFLYRIPGSFGFSPHARHWKRFVKWVLNVDLRSVDIDVEGTVTTDWHRNAPDSWEQFWIWWCFRKKKKLLYTLYAHSRNGALIGHWQEPGVHATEPARRNDNLLNATESVLEKFPKELEHYGWDYELEDSNRR